MVWRMRDGNYQGTKENAGPGQNQDPRCDSLLSDQRLKVSGMPIATSTSAWSFDLLRVSVPSGSNE